jgi:anti-sigma factor RsiW
MTDRENSSDESAHKVADALLPWLVNGTLDADERAFVETHVGRCERCSREVEWLRGLHAACIATSEEPGGAVGMRRLRDALGSARRRTGTPWRWAAVGALAAFAAAGTAWLAIDEHPALYRTLAAPDAAANAAIVVVFDPATSEFELRRIVRDAGARIVDGPTRTNAYVLDVPADRRTRALQTLKAERAVVLAERLDSRGRR